MKLMKKGLSVLLAVLMVVGVVPAMTLTGFAASASDPVVVIACSDFQAEGSNYAARNTNGANTVKNILAQIRSAGYTDADGFICCGDYDYNNGANASVINNAVSALKGAVATYYPDMFDSAKDPDYSIFVQGNHDVVDILTGNTGTDLDVTGEHDTPDYGVFVIDEDSYGTYWGGSASSSGNNDQGDEQDVINANTALSSYLDDKVAEGYSKPIFITAHLPLHFSTRTQAHGDNRYGSLLFNTINEAAESGLCIIYLCGHNHSQGYDDYIGGASYYFSPGDSINVAKYGSRTEYTSEELAFTYMNAGYVGYYDDKVSGNGNDAALTMSVFTITDSTVTIERFDANGSHNLRSVGNDTSYTYNGKTYKMNQVASTTAVSGAATIALPEQSGPVFRHFTDTPTGIEADVYGSALNVTEKENTTPYEGISSYKLYDITVSDFVSGSTAVVSIPVPDTDAFRGKTVKVFWVNGGELVDMNATVASGMATFETSHFSDYLLGAMDGEGGDDPTSGDPTSGDPTSEDPTSEDPTSEDPTSGDPTSEEPTSPYTWIEIPVNATYTYTLDTDGVDSGAIYLIVGTKDNTNGALVLEDGAISKPSVTVNNGTIETESEIGWVFAHPTEPVSMTVSLKNDDKNPIDTSLYVNNGYYYDSALVTSLSVSGKGKDTVWTVNGTAITVERLTLSAMTTDVWLIVKDGQYLGVSGKDTVGPLTTPTYWMISGSYAIQTGVANDHGEVETKGLKFESNKEGNNWKLGPDGTVSLYKLTRTASEASTYVRGVIPGTQNFSTIRFANQGALEEYLRSLISVYVAEDTTGAGTPTSNYTLSASGNVDPTRQGSTTYTVSYEGITLGQFTVSFTPRTVTGISLVGDNEGSVFKKSAANVRTSSYIYVTYDEGEPDVVEITADMLEGEFDLNTIGDYTGLTVHYNGFTVSGYTLHVISVPEPAYPQGGSVRVNKTGEAVGNFQNTGVAKIELSASGIPAQKGVDVIVMLDTSSSMQNNNMPDGKTRLQGLQNSLAEMIYSFQEENDDGSTPDIRVAIGDFNGYTNIGGVAYANSKDTFEGVNTNQANNGQVYTGSKSIGLGAFVDATSINVEQLTKGISYSSGTNYDYAFDTVYRMAAAVKADNEEKGVERELFVVFMSDGSPYQYNYFYSRRQSVIWNYWLTGELTIAQNGDITVPGNPFDASVGTTTYEHGKAYKIPGYSGADAANVTTYEETVTTSNQSHYYYYNGEGNPHRMAEAIKGSTEQTYEVIALDNTLPGSTAIDGKQYMYTVPGLGATMYTIGFCLGRDQNTTTETVTDVITRLASKDESGDPLYFDATNQAELDEAFTQISGNILEAAKNARFVDMMGEAYNIQFANTVVDSDGNVKALTENGAGLQFTVSSYDLYKANQVGKTVNGVTVTREMVGSRIESAKSNLETITFSADGTVATSDKLSSANLFDPDTGLLIAKSFIYNPSKTESVEISTVADGTFSLAPETFYWTIGTLSDKEVSLSYYVYLDGSMEGTRDAGTYATNESAILYYTNWMGDEAQKVTVSPQFSWKSASVSYAFYLVNEYGDIIDIYGNPTGFANRQQIGTVTLYKDALLNEGDICFTVNGVAVLPDGYRLFDDGAAYKVYPASDNQYSYWEITNTVAPDTTYVTNFNQNGYTNSEMVAGGSKGGYITHTDYTFTDTVVWFALVYTPKAQDDVVVIDYGLPVDITVLANDLPVNGATVAGLSTSFRQDKDTPAYGDKALDSNWNAKTLTLEHGIVTINGSKVRYTPTDMQMSAPESFSYALAYTEQLDGGSVTKYLYANVTVVPATILYYETDFNLNAFTFTGSVVGGSTTPLPTQAEDRPGPAGAFGNVDADNLYGYDDVYATARRYSANGYFTLTGTTAQSVNGEIVFGTSVSFTFTGTGFDVISRTGSTDGAVRATIENVESGDKYYVNVINKGEIDSLSQIPVISYNGLDYGTYRVTIGVYGAMTSIGVGNEFIFDAVRIFDPAKESTDTGTEYLTQRGANYFYALDGEEDPTFVEPRNLMIDAEALTTGSDAAGIAFVDKATYPEEDPPQTDDTEVTDHVVYAVTDYYTSETLGHGPNDEVYLAPGQAIAFSVDLDGVTGLHMGAKTIGALGDGSTSLASTAGLKVTVKLGGKAYITENRTITSPTDLKFDIFDGVELSGDSAIVVVESTGSGVLSITDLKVIHGTPAEEPVASVNPFFVNAATATFATAIMEDVKGDVNFDGVVTLQDTTETLHALAAETLVSGIDRVYDIDGDGAITIRDISTVMCLLAEG